MMMKIGTKSKMNRDGRIMLVFLGLLALTAFGLAHSGLAQQDGRTRRVAPAQTPSAAPKMATPTPTPTPGAQPTATPGDGQEINNDEVITVDTDIVNVNVRVVDRFNRPITNVQQSEFTLYEDGAPQEIKFFTKDEVPIAYGITVDNSGSLRAQITTVIEASKSIISSNRPGDETFVVRFTGMDNIELLQDFTSKKQDLMDAMEEKMLIEPGQTDIIDAVYLSVERLGQFKKSDDINDRRRRALILVTDGEQKDSYHKESELFDLLKENDVQIYVIGFVGELDAEKSFLRKSPQDKAVKFLTEIAEKTGGRVFLPKSLDELPGIANEITRDLRTQYVLSYYPPNPNDRAFHSLRVTVNDGPGKEKRLALTRTGRTAMSVKPTTPAPKPANSPAPKRP
jgi:Ca-activated chloride channel family protein